MRSFRSGLLALSPSAVALVCALVLAATADVRAAPDDRAPDDRAPDDRAAADRVADAGPEVQRPPNVLLISVDTLRADRLGAYGHPLATSPTIDALAKAGVLLEDVTATSTETAPTVASLLTGLHQHRHRVDSNRKRLPGEVMTLAERLQMAGYRTGGVVANALLGEKFGFDQGFEDFGVVSAKAFAATDALAVRDAIDWIGSAGDGPWFSWVHLFDPHGPYLSAPSSWSEEFDYVGDARLGQATPEVSESNFGLGLIPRYQRLRGAERLADYVRRYDGEIRWMDAQIAALLGWLSVTGRNENTLIVVTADHGESLTEHREFLQHGWFVYQPTVRVPTIVTWPEGLPQGRRVGAAVSQVDLFATIAELAGAPVAEVSTDGVSLVGLLRGETDTIEREPVYTVGARNNHPWALRDGSWKLVLTPAGGPPYPKAEPGPQGFTTAERVELYDLSQDPGEVDDRSEQEPKRVEAMLERLAAVRQRWRQAGLPW